MIGGANFQENPYTSILHTRLRHHDGYVNCRQGVVVRTNSAGAGC
jgi:hypothetical protein